MQIELSLPVRRLCRVLAEANPNRPVEVIAGNVAPRMAGRGYYWTTLSGKTVVRHPSAYRWPKVYHGSTRRVEVGDLWLIKHGLIPDNRVKRVSRAQASRRITMPMEGAAL